MNALSVQPSLITSSLLNATTKDTTKAETLAKEFESIFIAGAFKSMFEGVGEDDSTLSGGNAGLTWRDMLVDQYAKSIEKGGGFGLAKPIANSILHLQEVSAK